MKLRNTLVVAASLIAALAWTAPAQR